MAISPTPEPSPLPSKGIMVSIPEGPRGTETPPSPPPAPIEAAAAEVEPGTTQTPPPDLPLTDPEFYDYAQRIAAGKEAPQNVKIYIAYDSPERVARFSAYPDVVHKHQASYTSGFGRDFASRGEFEKWAVQSARSFYNLGPDDTITVEGNVVQQSNLTPEQFKFGQQIVKDRTTYTEQAIRAEREMQEARKTQMAISPTAVWESPEAKGGAVEQTLGREATPGELILSRYAKPEDTARMTETLISSPAAQKEIAGAIDVGKVQVEGIASGKEFLEIFPPVPTLEPPASAPPAPPVESLPSVLPPGATAPLTPYVAAAAAAAREATTPAPVMAPTAPGTITREYLSEDAPLTMKIDEGLRSLAANLQSYDVLASNIERLINPSVESKSRYVEAKQAAETKAAALFSAPLSEKIGYFAESPGIQATIGGAAGGYVLGVGSGLLKTGLGFTATKAAQVGAPAIVPKAFQFTSKLVDPAILVGGGVIAVKEISEAEGTSGKIATAGIMAASIPTGIMGFEAGASRFNPLKIAAKAAASTAPPKPTPTTFESGIAPAIQRPMPVEVPTRPPTLLEKTFGRFERTPTIKLAEEPRISIIDKTFGTVAPSPRPSTPSPRLTTQQKMFGVSEPPAVKVIKAPTSEFTFTEKTFGVSREPLLDPIVTPTPPKGSPLHVTEKMFGPYARPDYTTYKVLDLPIGERVFGQRMRLQMEPRRAKPGEYTPMEKVFGKPQQKPSPEGIISSDLTPSERMFGIGTPRAPAPVPPRTSFVHKMFGGSPKAAGRPSKIQIVEPAPAAPSAPKPEIKLLYEAEPEPVLRVRGRPPTPSKGPIELPGPEVKLLYEGEPVPVLRVRGRPPRPSKGPIELPAPEVRLLYEAEPTPVMPRGIARGRPPRPSEPTIMLPEAEPAPVFGKAAPEGISKPAPELPTITEMAPRSTDKELQSLLSKKAAIEKRAAKDPWAKSDLAKIERQIKELKGEVPAAASKIADKFKVGEEAKARWQKRETELREKLKSGQYSERGGLIVELEKPILKMEPLLEKPIMKMEPLLKRQRMTTFQRSQRLERPLAQKLRTARRPARQQTMLRKPHAVTKLKLREPLSVTTARAVPKTRQIQDRRMVAGLIPMTSQVQYPLQRQVPIQITKQIQKMDQVQAQKQIPELSMKPAYDLQPVPVVVPKLKPFEISIPRSTTRQETGRDMPDPIRQLTGKPLPPRKPTDEPRDGPKSRKQISKYTKKSRISPIFAGAEKLFEFNK